MAGDYLWLVLLSGVACFGFAWGTGANDSANSFGSSIGANALTIKQAVIIGAFSECLGAILLGGTVLSLKYTKKL